MFLSVKRLLVLLFCLLLVIGPIAGMQIVAWSGMLLSYSFDNNIAVALEKTFDGEHACSLCKVIQKEVHQREQEPAPINEQRRVELFFMRSDASELDVLWVNALRDAFDFPRNDLVPLSVALQPPVPPPQIVL